MEIIKTIDEIQKTTKEKQGQKGARGTEAIVKSWELDDSLSSIVFITCTLIISTFYCLYYTLLLFHLLTHLVTDFITM